MPGAAGFSAISREICAHACVCACVCVDACLAMEVARSLIWIGGHQWLGWSRLHVTEGLGLGTKPRAFAAPSSISVHAFATNVSALVCVLSSEDEILGQQIKKLPAAYLVWVDVLRADCVIPVQIFLPVDWRSGCPAAGSGPGNSSCCPSGTPPCPPPRLGISGCLGREEPDEFMTEAWRRVAKRCALGAPDPRSAGSQPQPGSRSTGG